MPEGQAQPIAVLWTAAFVAAALFFLFLSFNLSGLQGSLYFCRNAQSVEVEQSKHSETT